MTRKPDSEPSGEGPAIEPGSSASSEDEVEFGAAPSDFIGRELGGYKVVEKIAEGGMGEIFIGEHLQLGRRAALKLLKLEYCQNEEVVERFTQEARAVNAIRHEDIIDVYDIGRDDDGRVFFVMELLEGEALDRRIERGPMPWREAVPLFERTLRALQAAHDKGFVHRDLKPENLFLRRREGAAPTVKLLDFGIAKLTGSDRAHAPLTQTGTIMGTPHYMSPEQINGAAGVDHRTDVYALGVIFYEMLTGARPFASETLTAILADHLFSPPPRLVTDPALEVPEQVADIIERMLAKEASDRYDSVSDVLSDLHDVDASRPPSRAETLRRARPLTGPANKNLAPIRRRPLIWGAGAIAGAALVAGGIYVAASGPQGDPAAQVHAGEPEDEAPPALDIDEVRDRAQSFLRVSLDETEPRHRVQATDALGQVRDEPSVPELLRLVQTDPDQEVRGHAAGALGAIGDPEVAPQLEDIRKGASPALAVWLDEALERLGVAGARERLAAAARDEDLAISFKAALALAEASDPGDDEAIGALTALAAREAELADTAPYAGVLVLAELAKLHHGAARGALWDALEQPDEGARVAAADSLARLGDDAGHEVLVAVLADENSPNRLIAARALIALGDYSGFGLLTGELTAREPALRRQAARGLGELGEKESLAPLLDLLEDDDRSVGIAAAASLILIAGLDAVLLAQASVDWARSALGSRDSAVRSAAARSLGDLDREDAMPLLAQIVVDEDPGVRTEAARSAGKLRGPEAAREVSRAARQESQPEVKEAQVVALADIAEPEGRDALDEISRESSRVGVLASGALLRIETSDSALERLDEAIRASRLELRQAAAEGAALARHPRAVATLVTGVGDRDFGVRFTSAVGLAGYQADSDRAVPVLEEGLRADDPEVNVAAQIGLRQLGVTPSAGMSAEELLASPSAGVRRAAIPLIADMPWSDARSLVLRALADRDLEVRRGAVDIATAGSSENPADARRMFRNLIDDRDPVTRAMVRSQLARLIAADEGVELARTEPTELVPEPEDTSELAERLSEAEAARRAFEVSLEEAQAVAREIEELTSRPANDDEEVEHVASLAEAAERAGDRAIAAQNRLADAVMGAQRSADALRDPVPDAQAEALSLAATAAANAVARRDEAHELVATAERRAQAFARDETADAALYLTAARTATATGNLRGARQDLRRAERLYAAVGEVPAEVHFAYGQLYSRMALEASSDDEIIAHLERAATSFDRVIAAGRGGIQVEQSRGRVAEIQVELQSLRQQDEPAGEGEVEGEAE